MKILFYFILICALLSCSNKTETPSGIIPPKEMSEILWDVIRAQVLANEVSKKDSSVDVDMQTKTFTKRALEIHHTSLASFDKSYNWYSSHPDILRLMFDSLSTQKERENSLRMKERYIPFSKDPLSRKLLKK